MGYLSKLHQTFLTNARYKRRWDDPTKVYRDLILEDVKKQVFDFKDFKELGPDLAAGLMVLSQKGKVYYQDIGLIDDDERLPKKFDPNYRLQEIDANNLNLHYEGLFNFTALKYLQKLDLSSNWEMDNFCCDKLASLFYTSKTLTELKLHGNRRITNNGLVALAKIESLKHLTLTKFSSEFGFYNLSNMMIELFKEQRPDIDLKIYESNFLVKLDTKDIPSWDQKAFDSGNR